MGILINKKKFNYKAILFLLILLAAAFGYISFRPHPSSPKYYFRILTLSSFLFFSLALYLRPKIIREFIIYLIILISIINAYNTIRLMPGVESQLPKDIKTNLSGAKEIYQYGNPPYNIEKKYGLQVPSLSFPFPTYTAYWTLSGFGLWSDNATGWAFSIVNLLAILLTLWFSLKLAGINLSDLIKNQNKQALQVILFLIFTYSAWRVLSLGNTENILACLLVIAIWYFSKFGVFQEIFCGLLCAIAMLIKPNFFIFLIYPFSQWRHTKIKHHLRIGLLTILFALILIFITIKIPYGVNWNTYMEFANKALPRIELIIKGNANILLNSNISFIGVIAPFLPSIYIKALSVILLLGISLLGLIKKLPWTTWLVITLIVSPLTWPIYTTVLLPVSFLLTKYYIQNNKTVKLTFLIIGVGMMCPLSPIGLGGLLILCYLSLDTPATTMDSPLQAQTNRQG